jgi:hypothetical protein
MAATPQHLADADTVVGGPERALGEEDDRPAISFVDGRNGSAADGVDTARSATAQG